MRVKKRLERDWVFWGQVRVVDKDFPGNRVGGLRFSAAWAFFSACMPPHQRIIQRPRIDTALFQRNKKKGSTRKRCRFLAPPSKLYSRIGVISSSEEEEERKWRRLRVSLSWAETTSLSTKLKWDPRPKYRSFSSLTFNFQLNFCDCFHGRLQMSMPFFDCFYIETFDDFLSSNQLTEMGFFISCTMGCSVVSFNIMQSTLLVFIWLKILLYWVDNWQREDAAQLHQFILHAALDIVQDLAWTTSAMSVTCSVPSSRPFNLLSCYPHY